MGVHNFVSSHPLTIKLCLVSLIVFLGQYLLRSMTLSTRHVRAATPLLRVVAIGTLIIGALIVAVGVLLVRSGSNGTTTIRVFGSSFQSSDIGASSIFIGAAIIVIILTRLMKRLWELAALPEDGQSKTRAKKATPVRKGR